MANKKSNKQRFVYEPSKEIPVYRGLQDTGIYTSYIHEGERLGNHWSKLKSVAERFSKYGTGNERTQRESRTRVFLQGTVDPSVPVNYDSDKLNDQLNADYWIDKKGVQLNSTEREVTVPNNKPIHNLSALQYTDGVLTHAVYLGTGRA